jgi:hypothetical protein
MADESSTATNNGTIRTLEVEYKDLCVKETELLTLLQRLKREEESLSLVLAQVDPVVNKQQQQQRNTMKRLEEALLQESTSSSSSSSSSDEE